MQTTLFCWGENTNGEIGNGTTADQLTPTSVGSAQTWQSISAGGSHTCALTASLEAYCWGKNLYGQLGDDANSNRLTPTAVSGGHTWRSIFGGENHTCAVTNSEQAYCWGSNANGRLGIGTSTDHAYSDAREWFIELELSLRW